MENLQDVTLAKLCLITIVLILILGIVAYQIHRFNRSMKALDSQKMNYHYTKKRNA